MHDLQSHLLEELNNEKTLPHIVSSESTSLRGEHPPHLTAADEIEKPNDIKLEVQSPKVVALPAHEVSNMAHLPTSMVFMKSVDLGHHLLSISKHGNRTYAGFENPYQILKISKQNSEARIEQHVLANLDGIVSSLQVYNHEIFVFCAARKYHQVMVFDLSGKDLRSWSHMGNSNRYTMLRVVSDQVIVPSDELGSLCVYSLDGKLLKKIKCPVTKDSWKTMAICGDNSVIVCDCGENGSVVFRVDINSSQVVWISSDIDTPLGVVCYKEKFVLIASYNKDTSILILDAENGKS